MATKAKFLACLFLGMFFGFVSCGPSSTSSTNSSPLGITNTSVSKENYEKIKEKMSKDSIIEMMGKPDMVSETETPGFGKMEMHHYQLGMTAIDVTYLNGKVYSKNWTEL